MQEGFIKCKIVPGIFKDECGVIISLASGNVATSFVDKDDVFPRGAKELAEGRLRVFIKDVIPDGTLIYLPSETSTGQRTVLVNSELVELQAA